MNNFSTVFDFLLHSQKLHARIAEFYRELSAEASDERVKMLIGLLVKHEIELSTSIRQYIEETSSQVLDTFYQFDRERGVEHLFATVVDRTDIRCDDVQTIANRFDQYFSNLYDGMEGEAESDEVKALFANLRQKSEEEQKRLSTDINSMEDI